LVLLVVGSLQQVAGGASGQHFKFLLDSHYRILESKTATHSGSRGSKGSIFLAHSLARQRRSSSAL
jgi:hypothetical protein